MGTMISLVLNGIDIDWGKNRNFTNHYWLFPPNSLTDLEYTYANGVFKTKPGFQAPLEEVYFRLCHLGYSQQEAKAKFEGAVARWNRTADLRLSFADFRDALAEIDLTSLTSADLKPYIWDFRAFLLHRLNAWDTEDALLEEFINDLDVTLTLRALADRVENRALPLQWHHQDLVDSGWVSLADLTDIDLPTFIVNHTVMYGRLQEYAGTGSQTAFDNWLVGRGLPRATPYIEMRKGTLNRKETTLPTAVRNMIHHPENPHNDLSDAKVRESVEQLLGISKTLSSPIPGLT
ncbi:HEPN/Toprim-associated domain-containing protein [Paenarthrobacter nitroguajacolicus]|uniref:HEPN/Toprim-associated domain-containing protein n=1 Tax=Paenarthrobacter nitroguajacolicus TaxID=211146 RepID=UPI003D212309